MKSVLVLFITFFVTLGSSQAAYPEKPIRWIVPFPPGGAMDSIARTLGEQIAKKYGQPVVVENRPGAGGNLGVGFVATAPADGYTMVITSIGMVTNQFLYSKLSYDPVKDLVPVSQLAVVPNVLVINPNKIKARTLKDLLVEVQAKPGKFTYASAGNGTSIHLAGELFASMAGLDILHVPYRGSGPAMSDLIGGQVDMMFDSISSARPQVQAGKLIALGVTTPKKSPSMPEVQTIADGGLKGYELTPWFGVFMPAKTPDELVTWMNKALIEALNETPVKARLFVLGAEPIGSSPQAFKATLVAETQKWQKLIKDRNIRAD